MHENGENVLSEHTNLIIHLDIASNVNHAGLYSVRLLRHVLEPKYRGSHRRGIVYVAVAVPQYSSFRDSTWLLCSRTWMCMNIQ